MPSSVLIYDGECPYCSVAAIALRRLDDDVDAVSWYDDPVASFLEAQFDDRPFAMILIDPEEQTVYAGRSAAEELASRAGTPDIVGSLLRSNYERLADTVGTLSGRDRETAAYHGTYDLTDDATELLPALRENARDAAAVVDAADDVSEDSTGADSTIGEDSTTGADSTTDADDR